METLRGQLVNSGSVSDLKNMEASCGAVSSGDVSKPGNMEVSASKLLGWFAARFMDGKENVWQRKEF